MGLIKADEADQGRSMQKCPERLKSFGIIIQTNRQ